MYFYFDFLIRIRQSTDDSEEIIVKILQTCKDLDRTDMDLIAVIKAQDWHHVYTLTPRLFLWSQTLIQQRKFTIYKVGAST